MFEFRYSSHGKVRKTRIVADNLWDARMTARRKSTCRFADVHVWPDGAKVMKYDDRWNWSR